MPRQASRCCVFVFKDTLARETKVNHTKCNKTKVAYYLKGKVINLAYDCDSLKSEKHYRICATLMCKMKEEAQQLTKKRANVLDGVRGRSAVVSATKNLRELQEAYGLIVEALNQGKKAKEVKKRFVWMASMDDPPNPNPNPIGNRIGLFLQLKERTLLKVLEVKKAKSSRLSKVGWDCLLAVTLRRGEL